MKKHNWRLMLRRVLNLVFSRLVVTAVLLVLQVVWLFALFYRLADYARWFNAAGLTLSIIMCLALIRQDSTVPEFKISWMILFAVMPVQGGLLYLLWGNKRPALGLRRRQERAEQAMADTRREDPAAAARLRAADPRAALTARYLHDYAPAPLYGGTAVRYYPDGQTMLADMLPALQSAEHSIFVESFIIGMGEMWGQIHEILRRKAAAGLDVRVIYDDAGCLSLLPHNYAELLRAEGIRAFSFNRCVPVLNLVMNNRDHRKIMVIDGKIGFTGGVNLADEYINHVEKYGRWKDAAVMLEGEGVCTMTALFLQMWSIQREPEFAQFLTRPLPETQTKGFVTPYGDCPLDGERVGEMVYIDLLNRARHSVHIITPYLILDGELETALRFAAERGVDVHLILPGKPDKVFVYALAKTHYLPLLSSGVKISEWTPGFTHAKVMIMDGQEAVVGTINLDYRSLYHHFENAVWMRGVDCLPRIEADFQDTLAQCRTVEPTRQSIWQGKKLLHLVGIMLKFIAPLI